jgi:hypothetical protein
MRHLTTYLGLADHSERTLADSFRSVADGHARATDVYHTCRTLAAFSDEHRQLLAPVVQRYGEQSPGDQVDEPERLHAAGLVETRSGEIGLLRDLQDLHVLATLVQTTWTVVAQGAQALRDTELLDVATTAGRDCTRQLAWLTTRMKAAAPQALVVGTPGRTSRPASGQDMACSPASADCSHRSASST